MTAMTPHFSSFLPHDKFPNKEDLMCRSLLFVLFEEKVRNLGVRMMNSFKGPDIVILFSRVPPDRSDR